MKKSIFDKSHPARRRLNWLDSSKLDREGELLHIWSTPIYFYKQEVAGCAWHESVKQAIVTRANSPKKFTANWNAADCLAWPDPGVAELKTFINDHLRRLFHSQTTEDVAKRVTWSMRGWANYKKG